MVKAYRNYHTRKNITCQICKVKLINNGYLVGFGEGKKRVCENCRDKVYGKEI
jgi:hypothetical protein